MNWIETHLILLIVAVVVSWIASVISLIIGAKMEANPWVCLAAVLIGYGFIGCAFAAKVCCVISIVLKILTHTKGA
jgi:hypothetical protein